MSYAMTLVGEISNFSAKIVISRYKKVFTTAYLRNEMRYFISAESYFAHQLLSENAAVKVAITLKCLFSPCLCVLYVPVFVSQCLHGLPTLQISVAVEAQPEGTSEPHPMSIQGIAISS